MKDTLKMLFSPFILLLGIAGMPFIALLDAIKKKDVNGIVGSLLVIVFIGGGLLAIISVIFFGGGSTAQP